MDFAVRFSLQVFLVTPVTIPAVHVDNTHAQQSGYKAEPTVFSPPFFLQVESVLSLFVVLVNER